MLDETAISKFWLDVFRELVSVEGAVCPPITFDPLKGHKDFQISIEWAPSEISTTTYSIRSALVTEKKNNTLCPPRSFLWQVLLYYLWFLIVFQITPENPNNPHWKIPPPQTKYCRWFLFVPCLSYLSILIHAHIKLELLFLYIYVCLRFNLALSFPLKTFF